jgi:hypothetical protein
MKGKTEAEIFKSYRQAQAVATQHQSPIYEVPKKWRMPSRKELTEGMKARYLKTEGVYLVWLIEKTMQEVKKEESR